ncbi:hypothetical protein TNIN_236711 [Trichonephila inaurata madagascariensis]|uniref:Uncharacterized protein n=1 Tax=Trichonephila inaurata madagascariensis TaxID=2747483 RepID=A0A8X6MCJ5_9ARAC|nr:hypothetical protein TNIN_236711 [Trichonephila inaurata madagascariensis]
MMTSNACCCIILDLRDKAILRKLFCQKEKKARAMFLMAEEWLPPARLEDVTLESQEASGQFLHGVVNLTSSSCIIDIPHKIA